MKISIITVCFNSAEVLATAIESVIEQSYSDIEYIVVDGLSTDGTIDVIKNYKLKIEKERPDMLFKWISETDGGLYDAMNKGIAMATGDVVGILNSDDLYADNRVVGDVALRFENCSCDGVYGDLVYVDDKDLSRMRRYWKAGECGLSAFRKGWMLPHPTFFVRRELYKRFGGYRTDFTNSADYELILRFVYKHVIQLTYLQRILVRMRVGGVSNATLRDRLEANSEDRRAWKVNGLKAPVWIRLTKPLRKVSQWFCRRSTIFT
jgi:glycosyltransferase involved in cell wall biosynthesis